jgi:hypothetical protein
MGLSPGVPDTPAIMKVIPKLSSRHRRGESYAVRAASVLGGLHPNIRWRLPACDSVIADYSRSHREQAHSRQKLAFGRIAWNAGCR